jgi:hypothetical protein
MRGIRLPKTGALLAEAVAVDIDTPQGEAKTVDLRGRALGTDAGATRLFAIAVRRARELAPEDIGRARGVRARAVRSEWQGAPVERWIEITTLAPKRPVYVGTARRIYYRSNKHGARRPRTYVHDFGQPAPAVYRAGESYFLVGGRKRVTGRGIEG